MPSQPETIYAVYANSTDRRYLLGFATGEIKDIEAFFDDQKAYGLNLERVKAQHIPPGFADKRAALLQQKAAHEAEVRKIDSQLKHIGG